MSKDSDSPKHQAGTVEEHAKTPRKELRTTNTERTGTPASTAQNLDIILRIPVQVQVILGRTSMPVAELMKLQRGSVIALDHQVGEAVEVTANGRTIARGEVVLMEEDATRFGVSLKQIVDGALDS